MQVQTAQHKSPPSISEQYLIISFQQIDGKTKLLHLICNWFFITHMHRQNIYICLWIWDNISLVLSICLTHVKRFLTTTFRLLLLVFIRQLVGWHMELCLINILVSEFLWGSFYDVISLAECLDADNSQALCQTNPQQHVMLVNM